MGGSASVCELIRFSARNMLIKLPNLHIFGEKLNMVGIERKLVHVVNIKLRKCWRSFQGHQRSFEDIFAKN